MATLRSRWQALDRGSRVTLTMLAVLICGAVAVRLWLMISYSQAFLGYPDSSQYALAATANIFRDSQRPAGYPFFLRLVHHLSDDISVTVAVQHALGIVSGLLLYKAVRRTGGPRWLGLFPAAIVFFAGTGVLLEHALLADSLLAFLQSVVVYLAVRALYQPSARWWVLAGLAIGVSFWVKTVAISSVIVVPLILLCGAPASLRRRFLSAVTVAVVAVAMIFVYVGTQYYFTGYLGYERQSAWNLYGRVATFVNCSDLTPPSGTASLCPNEPVSHRKTTAYYQVAPAAPAVREFGPPWEAPEYANSVLEKFSVAAIEQQPIGYAEAVIGSLGRYIYPRYGEGTTPGETREDVIDPLYARAAETRFARLYPTSHGYEGSIAAIHPLAIYEHYTRVEGPLLILLLIAAIAGPFFLPPRLRWGAALFTLTALLTILVAVAGSGYDARYAYPTFGPLGAGAALGAWGIGYRLQSWGLGSRLARLIPRRLRKAARAQAS